MWGYAAVAAPVDSNQKVQHGDVAKLSSILLEAGFQSRFSGGAGDPTKGYRKKGSRGSPALERHHKTQAAA